MTLAVKFGRFTEDMTQQSTTRASATEPDTTEPDTTEPDTTEPDTRALYARTLDQTATVIDAVRPDQLDLPTPCPEWDVRTLLSHIVGVVRRTAILGEGGDALSVSAFVEGVVADHGWPAAYRAATDRTLAAWADDAKLGKPVTVPWGVVPGAVALGGYVREILAHGWDLAMATGQPTELDPDLAEFALEISLRSLTPEMRADERVPFGAVVPADPSAGPYARLAAWLGRQP
jgi:uncharacterized protein (TIGR03086 family)